MVTLYYELWDDQKVSAPMLTKQFETEAAMYKWVDEQNLNPHIFVRIVQVK
jgi:hypothetical protein